MLTSASRQSAVDDFFWAIIWRRIRGALFSSGPTKPFAVSDI